MMLYDMILYHYYIMFCYILLYITLYEILDCMNSMINFNGKFMNDTEVLYNARVWGHIPLTLPFHRP